MTDVCYVDISSMEESIYQKLYARASEDRKKRADRYLKQEDSYRCIVADALLRYVGRRVFGNEDLNIACTPQGKPYLTDQEHFHFSLTHSGHWVAIAWGQTPVGIDVEQFRADDRKDGIARRFFRSDEQAYLFGAQAEERTRRFFEIWTKKESYLKYLGSGLAHPMNAFSVLKPQALDVTFTGSFLPDAAMALCCADPMIRSRAICLEQLTNQL